MKIAPTANIIDFDPYDTRTAAGSTHQLGTRVISADRTFRYARSGASAISRGKLQVAPAPKTNHHNVAIAAAAAVGATEVTVTLGATAAVANEYNEGFLVINDVDGEGVSYQISSHIAGASSGSLTLKLSDPIAVALTTSSEATLVHNKFNQIVEASVATRRASGVPLVATAADDFVWLVTQGISPILADGAVAVGNAVVISDAVAGAGEQQDVFVNATDATRLDAKTVVGRANILALVDTEYRPIVLAID